MTVLNRILAVLVFIMGLALLAGGIWLVVRAGSPYYLVVGAVYVLAAVMAWRSRAMGSWLLVAVAVLSVPWALWESGLDYWALFPRLLVPFALAGLGLLLIPASPQGRRHGIGRIPGVVVLVATLVFFGFSFVPHGVVTPEVAATHKKAMAEDASSDWSAWGRTNAGTRYAPFTQINRDNVADLDVAWTYRTGEIPAAESADGDQNTPLQIGHTLYTCTPRGKIAAVDADTGKAQWTYQSEGHAPFWNKCRGLAYYKVPTHSGLAGAASVAVASSADTMPAATVGGVCRERIVHTSTTARLIELDAKTGKRCPGFGDHGVVDLKRGMGEIKPGFYFQTAAPLMARHYIIVGGWVTDNHERDEPSGVIRAYDARTGKLAWAWDMGHPARTGAPPAGETYTRGTPNMWSSAAYDDKLGLIYVPLGNETPDYFGMGRRAVSNRYNSSLVALDIETGRPAWHFQTVHHDIWDYDLPSQPALMDLPDGAGGTVPAVMQTTKRGQIFLLNRATGKPIAKVEEKPVVTAGAAPQEKLSPTQPYSVGMPTIGAMHLTGKKMWGMTMFDQLLCRIQFNSYRYSGDFTPVGLDTAIQQPGNLGGMNWGSVSYDPNSHVAYVNDIRIPSTYQLVSRDKYNDWVATGHGPSPMNGTPYGIKAFMWMSPLGVPCVQPPFGTLTAIDMDKRRILWQRPAGTAEELGPMGIKLHLPMAIGMPTYAGTMTTAGGLVFFAGFQDDYIRAYDAHSGKLLWKHALPVGSSATPMSYVSPRTGKQYVLISVGGAGSSTDTGDYVMAFALPGKAH